MDLFVVGCISKKYYFSILYVMFYLLYFNETLV